MYAASVRNTFTDNFHTIHNPYTTGFVVGPKMGLHPYYQATGNDGFWQFTVWVRGYLVPDK
jgi:hypothetical protein